MDLSTGRALFHKWAERRGSPFTQTGLSHSFRDEYAERRVAILDGNVNLDLATSASKSLAKSRWPSSLSQRIFVPKRLRRWYPF